jgi:hypothetical protein
MPKFLGRAFVSGRGPQTSVALEFAARQVPHQRFLYLQRFI